MFSVNFSETIKDTFDVRTDSDYQDFCAISWDDVQQQIDDARKFLQAVQENIDNYTRNEQSQ